MEMPRQRRRWLSGGWLLAALASLTATATAAPAPASATFATKVVGRPAMRPAACGGRLPSTECDWQTAAAASTSNQVAREGSVVVGAYGLRWDGRLAPFSAGWKNGYGGGGRLRRRLFAGGDDDDERGVRNAFSSWGGKRSRARARARLDYGGASSDTDRRLPTTFVSGWSGKRSQRFFNWGGKRSLAQDELKRMATATATAPATATATATTAANVVDAPTKKRRTSVGRPRTRNSRSSRNFSENSSREFSFDQ